MKPFSIAVDTAWKLAVWEASAINSEFIEKEHAVIGLLSLEKVAAGKPDDMKLSREQWNSVRAEWSALQEVFTTCSLEASTLCRELRKRIGKGSHQHTENVIHRSSQCKAFFQINKGKPLQTTRQTTRTKKGVTLKSVTPCNYWSG